MFELVVILALLPLAICTAFVLGALVLTVIVRLWWVWLGVLLLVLLAAAN